VTKHGKNYLTAARKFDIDRLHEPVEALKLVKEMATAKFDETVEVHMRLNIDPRQADQLIRGTVNMPAGLGKTVRILVFAEGEAARAAKSAGADIVAGEEEIAAIQNGGALDFDIAIAVPEMMSKVGRVARILGPRGMMPNPKADTVVQPDDLGRVIKEARAGKPEYRNDRTGNLHVPIGKASFSVEDLTTNFRALLDAVRRDRPATVKGIFIRKLVVTSTMGPGVKIDPNVALNLDY
jgi:large subunit ribosomal protein L1